MIQLDNKKKIFILVAVILIIIALIFILSGLKKSKINNQIATTTPINNQVNVLPPRIMTKEEKVKVRISPSQNAEVINDRDGWYIYRLKK